MGPTPCDSQSQVVSACQSFRPIAPFFFLAKVSFFEYRKGCGHVDILRCTPGVTDSKYRYGFVGLAATIQA